ncbi:MAG: DNA methyltransferase [Tepidisphaerales bacterium]
MSDDGKGSGERPAGPSASGRNERARPRRFKPASGAAGPHAGGRRKPPLRLQVTTLWDYPSQHYGPGMQGDAHYRGATPSYIIWNLLQRYTKPGDLVVDPCCGSGTTLDVARELGRRALGYDVHPTRPDIFRVDARKLPPELTGKVDFVFIDPPYSTHLDYGPDPRDIGKLDAASGAYYTAMEAVIGEIARVLRPGGHVGLYVSDSYEHDRQGGRFFPLGFELFSRMRRLLTPVDIIAVTRHNRTLQMGNYRRAAEEGNFFLRGFNYLLIFRKPREGGAAPAAPT